MLEKKKDVVLRAIAIACILFVSLTVSGIIEAVEYESPYKTAYLSTLNRFVETDPISGTHKFFSGRSYEGSNQAVRIQAYYSTGDRWVADKYRVVNAGTEFSRVLTSFTPSTALWKLRIENTNLLYPREGGMARGWIWYDMD